mmetsp:Transcript_3680/g.12976  ORF Transcript_3680/g.12976 Transcript_3680/m.12976 type:complete len:194 (+) Transcript_3680:191-772(+)
MGNYVRRAQQKGMFLFIDGMAGGDTWSTSEPCGLEALPTASLKRLFATIEEQTESSPTGLCIVIDCIAQLLAWSAQPLDVLKLIRNLCSLVKNSPHTLVFLMHAVEDEEIEEEAELQEVGAAAVTAELRHFASLHIHCGPLITGYSKDIHGKLSITQRAGSCTTKAHGKPLPDLLHYKVTEVGVKVFVPGSSR